MTTNLEATFLYYWRIFAQGLPDPIPQHMFHPKRKWRLDYAFVQNKVGIELQGAGAGGYGRRIQCHRCRAVVRARKKDGSPGKELRVPYPSHATGSKNDADANKNIGALLMGWRIVYITPGLLTESKAEKTIATVVRILDMKGDA